MNTTSKTENQSKCEPLDLFCRLREFSEHMTRVHPDVVLEAVVEIVDGMIPVVGPFLDNPVVDAIEKNAVKNIVEFVETMNGGEKRDNSDDNKK